MVDPNHTKINMVHLEDLQVDKVQLLAIMVVITTDTGMMDLTTEIIRHHHHRNIDIPLVVVDHLLKCEDLLKTVLHAMTSTIDVVRHIPQDGPRAPMNTHQNQQGPPRRQRPPIQALDLAGSTLDPPPRRRPDAEEYVALVSPIYDKRSN